MALDTNGCFGTGVRLPRPPLKGKTMKITNSKKVKKAPAARDIAKRWTPALVKNGWTPVSDDFLKLYAELNPVITSSEAMFIVHLMLHKWDCEAPFPAFKTIAARMGLTEAQARTHARNLERKKYLRREMRVGETNRFHLEPLFKAVEAHQLRKEQMAAAT